MSDAKTEAGAMFAFDDAGLLVSADDTDNPDNHVVPHHDAGTKVSFSVWNVGGAAGQCTVGIEVDNSFVTEWVSGEVQPGASESPPEVKGLGRYDSGQHEFLAYLNPGAGTSDHVVNTVNIE